ncbi:MAG: MarR family winged helix-turn-helix transcriptional regulator [Stenotrophobium sp.]
MDQLRSFGFLLRDVSLLSSKNFERQSTGLNLTLAQCKVLIHLQRNSGITQVRLAALTGTDPMTLVRILDRMERDGWVKRRPDPRDRRARQLYLCPPATPVLRRIWKIADRARAQALADLSEPERTQLLNLMGRIHNTLKTLVPCESEPVSPTKSPASRTTAGPAKIRNKKASK